MKREGTLDGAVPLRVAQARADRRPPTADLDEVDSVHHAAIGYLAAHGWLRRGGAWYTQLAKKWWWWVERGVLRVWTDLLVRPRPGGPTARRSRSGFRAWSSIIEGVRGPGSDVMRGVVWTDRFHATPAVFSPQAGPHVWIAAGAPLLDDVVPFPRSLAGESFTLQREG